MSISDHYSPKQSMQIACQFLRDILVHLYPSWQACASDIATMRQNDITKRFGQFAYTLDHLRASVALDISRVTQRPYNHDDAFYLH